MDLYQIRTAHNRPWSMRELWPHDLCYKDHVQKERHLAGNHLLEGKARTGQFRSFLEMLLLMQEAVADSGGWNEELKAASGHAG